MIMKYAQMLRTTCRARASVNMIETLSSVGEGENTHYFVQGTQVLVLGDEPVVEQAGDCSCSCADDDVKHIVPHGVRQRNQKQHGGEKENTRWCCCPS